jgi:hypothetical protein
VEALTCALEDIPLGRFLESRLVLGALDSRRSRAYLAAACTRLGIPYLDAGVDAEGKLARVSIYPGGAESSCYGCQLEPSALATAVRFPCEGPARRPGPPPTRAPSALGSLAASLLGIECLRVLESGDAPASASQEILVDAEHRRMVVTRLVRSPSCPLGHGAWRAPDAIDWKQGALTVASLHAAARRLLDDRGPVELEVFGQVFLRGLLCRCGRDVACFRLERSIRPDETKCPACGGRLEATSFHRLRSISDEAVSPGEAASRLDAAGFLAGDIVLARDGSTELALLLEEPSHA